MHNNETGVTITMVKYSLICLQTSFHSVLKMADPSQLLIMDVVTVDSQYICSSISSVRDWPYTFCRGGAPIHS